MAGIGDTELYVAPAVHVPSVSELESISNDLRLKCTDEELQVFQEMIQGTCKAYDRLNLMVEPQLPVEYPRLPGHREKQDDAWYWRCDIQGAADGKLKGKTFAIKDSIPVACVPMMDGSKILEGYTPEFDATVVTRILDAGGRILGKAVCEDMCLNGHSWTSSTGPVRNPHDETKTTGGSSSGCASLVARGKVDIAIGGDQGGSVRVPASACGIVGLKPTFGLVPYTGAATLEITIDHLGPMTRTVTDCASCLEVIAGYDDGLDPRQHPDIKVPEYTKLIENSIAGKRIGLMKEGFDGAEPDIVKWVKQAANRLTELGAIVEEMSLPAYRQFGGVQAVIVNEGGYACMVEGNGTGYNWQGHYPTSLQEAFTRGSNLRPQDKPPTVKMLSLFGEYIKRNYQNKFYAKAQNIRRVMVKEFDDILKKYDVLVLPTIPISVSRLPTTADDLKEKMKLSHGMLRNTAAFNTTGHPALTIDTGLSNNLPVGMMIVGRKFDDVTVLQVARAYEKLRDQTT